MEGSTNHDTTSPDQGITDVPIVRSKDKTMRAIGETIVWAKKTNYQPTSEDKDARQKTATDLQKKTMKYFWFDAFTAFFFVKRYPSGLDFAYSPIKAAFVKYFQLVRFGNPPASFWYRASALTLIFFLFSKQNERAAKDALLRNHIGLKTPFGAELRNELRKFDPDSPYLRNAELDDYDARIKEQEFDNISTSSDTHPASTSNVNFTRREEGYSQGSNFIFGEEEKGSEEDEFTKRRRERLSRRKHAPQREAHEHDMDR